MIGANFPRAFSRDRLSLDGNYSQHHGSAQDFHGIAAHADVGNALSFARCSDIHLARATTFDALTNQHLLISFCDSMSNHPTRAAACRRPCSWVFAAVKKHSRSSFKSAFASFGTQKVEKVGAGVLQKVRCLCVTKLEIGERLSISEWDNREGQPCGDGLYRPFRTNLVNSNANDASDVFSGKCWSKFGIALAHFTEHLTVHAITPGILGIRSETHRDFPGFQIKRDLRRSI